MFHSADATIASQATGAMSYAFISAIKQNPNQSYVELLNSIREILEAKYSQKPQLSCSHPLGMLNYVYVCKPARTNASRYKSTICHVGVAEEARSATLQDENIDEALKIMNVWHKHV